MAKELLNDELWSLIEPLLPERKRRYRYTGRKRVSDRDALRGILFVLTTGIPWEYLPKEMGCSGMTCWRRLKEWEAEGVWDEVHKVLLSKLRRAKKLDLSRAVVDSSSVRAIFGGPRRVQTLRTVLKKGPNSISSRKPVVFR